MSKQTTTHFVAGLLIRRQVRNALDSLIFRGEEITYHENKGWIDSTFTLKGDKAVVRAVVKTLYQHFE